MVSSDTPALSDSALTRSRPSQWYRVQTVYAATIFVSAFLLFLIEPMFAKMVLPLYGGSPAVWNTAVVFYQVALLVGYLYAHLSTKWLGVRRQALLQLGLLLLPAFVLPIALTQHQAPPATANPTFSLLLLMLTTVGLPFVILSSSSPVVQRWFASTDDPAATDPYTLYVASNVGSMVGLLSYPLLIEPGVGVGAQSRFWALGYWILALLMVASAALLWRSGRRLVKGPSLAKDVDGASDGNIARGPITLPRRLRWILLAFVPSSLMLSVTTYLSTDLPSFPLLWVLPLVLYLLSFILVFSQARTRFIRPAIKAMPVMVVLLIPTLVNPAAIPIWVLIPLHLAAFLVIAVACHGVLAEDRPAAGQLTEFYLWMSFGGALGGAFNALLAPLLFTEVLEYPLGLVLAVLFVSLDFGARLVRQRQWVHVLVPIVFGAFGAAVVLRVVSLPLKASSLIWGVVLSIPAVLVFRRTLPAARLGAVVVICVFLSLQAGDVLYMERSFFGINRVRLDSKLGYRTLIHGSTIHGMEAVDPSRVCEPLSYYYRTGPIGQFFAALNGTRIRQVAVVGLGAGSLAAYRQPGQQWTFYEIDPAVERIARDPRFFSYLPKCAPDTQVILGDARLSLTAASPRVYDFIVLDAYSSDAVPLHLITREALGLYLEKLNQNGVLAFHISNRYFDLRPVLAKLAGDAGLVTLAQRETRISPEEKNLGKHPSEWVLMARRHSDFGGLAGDSRWQPLEPQARTGLWTDDYSSVLHVWKW